MTPIEIALLVIGVIIFVVSFFIPDNSDVSKKVDREKEQLEIRRMLERELDSMKLRVNEATDETVQYSMEKTERSLEKVCNEKIMAVHEYADTIMEEINKSHKEVMFLYDMLNDKQIDLKNTVRKAEATVKEVESISRPAVTPAIQSTVEAVVQPIARPAAVPALQHDVQPAAHTAGKEEIEAPKLSPLFSRIARQVEKELEDDALFAKTEPSAGEPANLNQAETSNHNQRILSMFRQGLSNVEIARELNIGVGEVKLVIDLFNG